MENSDHFWLEVSVYADREAAETVSAVFASYAYGGGVAIDEDIAPSPDGGFDYNLDKPVLVKAYLADDDQAGQAIESLRSALDHLSFLRPIAPLNVRRLAEEDWANAWKEHYHVLHLGRHLVIVPSWRQYDGAPEDVVVRLDPGMAFGTGLHPTTRGCLERLEDFVQPGMSVLDVGAGSAILSLVAARLGARSVVAVEVDPVAAKAARENVRLNYLEDIIDVREGSLPLAQPLQFDLVVANIIARVIAELARPLAQSLRPGARLVTSGIIAERESIVLDSLRAAGLHVVRRDQDGDWVTLTLSSADSPSDDRPSA
jgi:ribosomal protein L11 methyltransferase